MSANGGVIQVEASDRFMTKKELAVMLNFSEKSVDRFVEQGLLPSAVYFNNRPRWRRSEVEEFLAKLKHGGNQQ